MEELVQRIKAYMELEGHSPSSLANALGINRPTLVHILNGRNKPNLQLIQKLCEFDVELDIRYILSGHRSKKLDRNPTPIVQTIPEDVTTTAPTPPKAINQKLLVLNPNGTWETYTKEA
ncbi:helix-turn-helix domain-containing protein [Schleiferiaceae bacterium]|jgi:transcriptional regulator with XRE-family HTH domain|nr:helix-turn-helix domain-containing protein [Schleiferiaceae bacterium]